MTKIILFFLLFISALTASATDKASVQLLWKNQFEFAGFYMSKEMGFYKDVGLDIELKEFNFGTDITKDVENGISTFGVGYPHLILDKSKGAKIILLNALYQSSPHILVVLEKSGIKTIKDFKNKTVMIENDAITNAPLLSMLYSQKLSLDEIKLVKPSFNIDDLISGKVDVFSAYSSNELYKLDELGIKYRIFDPRDFGFDFYNDILFTSQNLAKTNPEMVQKFQQATLKGWEYAFANINETIHTIETKYNTQNKSRKALAYEANVLKKLAYKNGIAFGNIDANKLKRIQDVYGLMGFMKTDIDYKEFLFDAKKVYLSQEELDFIKKTTLTVSTSKDCRPFSFQDKDGTPNGISAEFWNILVKELGLSVKYTFRDTFTEQLDDVKNKKADIIFSTGKTKEREEYALFTKEYISFPVSIATLNHEDFIEDFSKVVHKKIAVGRNFTAQKLLQELYPNINFVFVETIADGLKLVQKGDVYGFVDMKPALSYNIKMLKLDNIKIAGNTGAIFKVSIMVRNDYPLLQSILNKTISSIDETKLTNIVKRYDEMEFQKIYDYEFLYPIFIILGLVLLLVSVRQYILNKSNKNLQKIVEEKTKNLKLLNETLEEKIRIAVAENTNKDVMLYQQAKMASMGEMIGNIAHQWRQPLSVISTTVTGLNFKMEYGIDVQPEEMIENLERVNDTVQFLSKTIDDFQNYLKPQDVEEKFNIKEVIVKNLEMFGKAFENNDIKIILNFDDIFLVNSKNELLQVAINVLNNAKDALKEFVSENRLLFVSIYKEDNNAIISIKDNAGGIPEEVLPKIFDAYFTTKHKSQGTGLGLYMSYQIITNRFNGSIDVTNDEFEYMGEIYKGANFKLILPIDTTE